MVTHIRARGLSLIELMTALAIGSLLILAAVQIFARGRTPQHAVTAVASLQENARFALSALARDIEQAGFYGWTNRSLRIEGRALTGMPPSVAVANDCATGWSIDIDTPIAASNNAFDWACRPYSGSAVAESDTLVLRHAGAAATVTEPGRIYVETTRLGTGRVFAPPATAAFGVAETSVRELRVRGYYVSPSSSLSSRGDRVPSLRVKTLGLGPRVVDEEVAPGIEDLQIELGIDLDAETAAGFGAVDGYVEPNAVPPGARILAVRVWLLVRAIDPENGFTDTRELRYSDRVWPARDDRHRRAVYSATIFVNNAPGV